MSSITILSQGWAAQQKRQHCSFKRSRLPNKRGYHGYTRVSALSSEEEVRQLRSENLALKKKLLQLQKEAGQVVDLPQEEEKEEGEQPQRISPVKDQSKITWPSPNENPPFWERSARADILKSPSENGTSVKRTTQDERSLYVVHVTAEMAPIAKVGGLGDVVTGLSRACMARGHHVEVILPFYQCIPDEAVQDLEYEMDFDCPKARFWDGQWQHGTLKTSVWKGRIAGVQVFLLRPDWDACDIFKGGRIYGGGYNETEAYLYFSRASLEFLKVTNRQPHVLHIHEWQAAAVSMLYWEKYHHDGLELPRLVLTIHNMDSSGECTQDEFGATGVHGELFAAVDKALDDRTIGHNPERLNMLKGGIVYSSAVTTVSPTYADEILNGGAAGWLRGTLGKSEIRSKFRGILNGIDIDDWCPEHDTTLPANFSAKNPAGKKMCKEYLQKGLGLTVDASKPLVVCITRLVPQKGVHLICHAVHVTARLGGQFVLLGTGHADGSVRAMSEGEFQGHPDVRLLLLYSESLAHLIYAAADVVLVPSMFEPCGLTQMIAMRYGALPVVRRTGGLADTVEDVSRGNGNGFVFDGVDEGSVELTLSQALSVYQKEPAKWAKVARQNMTTDFSWEQSAGSYVEIYNSVSAF